MYSFTRTPFLFLSTLLLLLFMSACQATEEAVDDLQVEPRATAEITPLGGGDVSGTVTFEEDDDGVHVNAEITGLSPGLHGFHIHEGTSCEEPGGHFNPMNSPHGTPTRPANLRHVGDLGNLVADDDGRAVYEGLDHLITLTGDPSIVGQVLIIHAGEDEILPQPSGDAGMMIACGVITMVDQDIM